jgi:hypothetical protein
LSGFWGLVENGQPWLPFPGYQVGDVTNHKETDTSRLASSAWIGATVRRALLVST